MTGPVYSLCFYFLTLLWVPTSQDAQSLAMSQICPQAEEPGKLRDRENSAARPRDQTCHLSKGSSYLFHCTT